MIFQLGQPLTGLESNAVYYATGHMAGAWAESRQCTDPTEVETLVRLVGSGAINLPEAERFLAFV